MVQKRGNNEILIIVVVLLVLIFFSSSAITGEAKYRTRQIYKIPSPVSVQESIVPSYQTTSQLQADSPTTACSNGVKDGTESDIDCGGSTCVRCTYGQTCGTNYPIDSNCKTGLKCLDTYPSVSGQNRKWICGTITETDNGFDLTNYGTLTKTAGIYSLTLSDACIDSTTLNETHPQSTYLGYRTPVNCVRTVTSCNVGNTSCSTISTTQCSSGTCL